MGGFMGIGGSAAKTDRSNQLTSFSGLKNLFNWSLPAGQSSIAAGTADTGAASNYYKSLLGGNRAALSAAVAPETAAIQSGDDAARRQAAATATSRGGGTAGINQQTKDATMAKIQNLLFGVRPSAAAGLQRTGATNLAAGTNLLSTAGTTATNLGSLALGSRQTSLQQDNALGQSAGELAMALLFA